MSRGVFVGRSMTVGVPPGGLTFSIGPDGKISGSLSLHVGYDVVPTWLGIAMRHLGDATTAELARNTAWATGDEDLKFSSLEQEFVASMQCITASAIALDAFYAVVRPKVTSISADLLAIWKTKRTARHAQIAEVLRRAFNVKPERAKLLKTALKDMFKYRI
jgi:hypothetical protein